MTTFPELSTATQKLADGHETEVATYGSMLRGLDQAVPFQVRASPALSTAAQKLADAVDVSLGGLLIS